MKFQIRSGGTRSWVAILGTASALATGLLLAGSAQAAVVDCDGSIGPLEGSKSPRAFEYDFSCTSPQGNEEAPTKIDAYSIVSTKSVLGFNANALVFDPAGEVVASGEQFGCEGPFPGYGIGCNGAMSLGNTAESDLTLAQNPCSKKGVKTPFNAWVVVAADKIKDDLSHVKQISEPFKLDVAKCPKPVKKPGHKGHKGGRHS